MNYRQPNLNLAVSQHGPSAPPPECHKCAIQNVCAYSRAGGAGTRTCASLPAPYPNPAPARTVRFASGNAGDGRGWQEVVMNLCEKHTRELFFSFPIVP